MKVEGSVTLQVNIDKDGNIVEHSGAERSRSPGHRRSRSYSTLALSPHYKNGAPVETDARVVVNFTIFYALGFWRLLRTQGRPL